MRWAVLVILIIVAAGFIFRESLVVSEGRRNGLDEKRLYRRFRRRTKGMILMIVLYISTVFFEDIALTGIFSAREAILYIGATFILLIWLLIIASRDMKEVAHNALFERQRITLESLAELEKTITEKKKDQSGEARHQDLDGEEENRPSKEPPPRRKKKRKKR